MTVMLDAYLREVTEEHLLRLSDDLREIGYLRPVFVAKNVGGLVALALAGAAPVRFEPRVDVIGADHIGKLIGVKNIIIRIWAARASIAAS